MRCHNLSDTVRHHGLLDFPIVPSEPVGAPHVRQLRAGQRVRSPAQHHRPQARQNQHCGHHLHVLPGLHCWALRECPRHLRHPALRQDEDGDQHLHPQPGGGRCALHARPAVHRHPAGAGPLAVRSCALQGGDDRGLPEPVHVHLLPDRHEHRPLFGCGASH